MFNDLFSRRPRPTGRNALHPKARGSRRRRGRDAARGPLVAAEPCEIRRVLAAVPTVVFASDPPLSEFDQSFVRLETAPFIGETNAFTLRFDNASATDTGFGPYVDLYLPLTGKDGVYDGTDPADAYDGIGFVSATYLGSPLVSTTITLSDDPAGVPHPFAKDAAGNPRMVKLADLPGFKAGDQLVVLELPLGSVTPGQPPIDILVTTSVSGKADVGEPLDLRAEAGFRFGGDGLDNPTSDPPLVGGAATQAFVPTLFKLTKENLAPEYETATGPNFVRQYRLRVDVADGQTLTDLRFTDILPQWLQFVNVVSITGGTEDVSARITPDPTQPGGTLERLLASVTGTTSPSDAELVFSYFVPVRDTGDDPVLDAASGDDFLVANEADVAADWVPLDARDPAGPVSDTAPTTSPLGVWNPDTIRDLEAKSIATQKSVSVPAGGAVPGAVLTYTIHFQVSDYFAFENVVLSDLLGDGQSIDPSFVPTLTVADGHFTGGTTGGDFGGTTYSVTPNFDNGKDRLVFDVSAELIRRGFSPDGKLIGGMIPSGGVPASPGMPDAGLPGATLFGATQGTIVFKAIVQDAYSGSVASGEQPLDPGDLLVNDVTVSGDILDLVDLATQVGEESDGSHAWTRVPGTTFSKSVYAFNGDETGHPLPAGTLVTAGDTITYRIRYTLPTSDVENLVLTDYLPLPLFDVDDAGTAITGFDAATNGTGAPPPAGRWTYAPGDTFHAINPTPPTVGVESTANAVVFNFGTFDDPQNRPSVVDILFTVTASNRPFTDGLRLANRASIAANNSANEPEMSEAIAEVTSSEPELAITKGIVSTDNANGVFTPSVTGPVAFNAPGTGGSRFTGTVTSSGLAAAPVNSDLSRVDNGDLVTYAIVVENRGSGRYGAFDTVIQDRPAAGLAIPGTGVQGINLRVTDGAGNPLPFEIIGTGLFEGGIRLVDPSSSQGAIRRGVGADGFTPTADGSNIVVVTYDMRVLDNVVLSRHVNTAAVTEYAATEGGPDFTGAGEIADQAVVTIATDELIAKSLVSTEIGPADGSGNNAVNEAVIGELVTYRVTITVPEAVMPNATLLDTLSSRMAFVELVGVTPSPGVSFTGSTTPVISGSGRTVTFDLGTITNTDTDNATRETITFEYRAVVLNRADAQGGSRLQNTASLDFDGLASPKTARAAIVTVIEPTVRVAKTAAFDDGNPTGDADDAVTYTIVLSNPAGQQASTADAFDVTFEDALPTASAGGSLIVGNGGPSPTFTVTDTAGIVTAADFELVGDDATGYTLRTRTGAAFDLPVSNTRTITIKIQGKLPAASSGLVTPGDVISNSASALWSSLPGDVSSPRSPHNGASVERTGVDGPGGLNDYAAASSADLQVTGVGIAKSVAATSESATTDPARVVVGEIVRYRLVASIPEGTAFGFQLRDQLPAGLQFLNDGTAMIAIVSNGIGIGSSTITSGAGLNVTGDAAAGVTPTFVIPSGAILGGPTFSDGTDVTFDLGDVVNADSDADEEFVIVEFNAIVTNVAGNQAGKALTNVVNVYYAGTSEETATQQGSSSAVVRVSEPSLSTQKSAVAPDGTTPAPGPYDAGDTVRYRIDVLAATDTTASTAYDVVLQDTLSAEMALVAGSLSVVRNGTTLSGGFTAGVVGQVISVTIDEIAPGDEIQVFYEVVLNEDVVAGSSLPNLVQVTSTSLPGDGTASNPTGSTAPGGGGSPSGERDGSGGVNNYSTSAETSVLIASPELEKAVILSRPVETTSIQGDPDVVDFAVGEIVTYRLTVTLPEGTTSFLTVSDLLPGADGFFDGNPLLPTLDGRMMLTSATVSGIGANITGSSLAVGDSGTSGAGGAIQFAFGSVVNLPDGAVTDADRITIDVVAQVVNIATNQDGDVLTNTATLTHAFGTATATASGEVVEPDLETVKEIVTGPTTTAESVSADAGDTVTFRVTVRHTANSHAPAYSVEITDTLPAGLELVPGSVTVITHPDYASSFYDQPVVTEGVGGDPNALSVFIDYIDQPDNEFANGDGTDIAVIEYRARVTTALAGGSTITNTANVAYDSLFRRSSSVPEQSRDYETSDTAAVVTNVVDLSITKTDGSATYVPGLPVTYTIVVTNDGVGFVRGATVSDDIPASITNPAWTVAYAGTGSTGPASGSGDIAATIDLASGGTATFTVTGTVAPTTTGNLVNTASVTPPGGVGDPTPGNNTATDTDTPAPQADLSITKTDNRETYSPGTPITYTIVVTNAGPSFVTGATVTDDIPSSITGVAWTVAYAGAGSTGPAGGSGDIAASVNLAVGGTATFTVNGTVAVTATGDLVNIASVAPPSGTTDTTPGNNTATDTDEFEPRVDLAITKTDGRETYQAGATTTYTIVVTNVGPGAAVNARVSDTLPANVSAATWTAIYSPGSSGAASGSGAIDTPITLLPGGSAIFTFVATVTATATGNLVNTATVTAPEGAVDTDPSNNSATDTNKLPSIVVGSDVDCESEPRVSIIDPFTGAVRATWLAYEAGFRGGVRAVLSDLDGDGVDEVVTAPGGGRAGEVLVFDQQGNRLAQYAPLFPFGTGWRSGVNLAGGDLDADGDHDLVVSKARGAGDVKVYESRPSDAAKLVELVSKGFTPFERKFNGGSTVAIADVGTFASGATVDAARPDRRGEIVVGSGSGRAPSVLVYDVSGNPTVIDRIAPFTASLRSGVSVSSGRFDADTTADIFVAGGRGAGSVTEIFDGRVAAADNARLAQQAAFASLAGSSAPVFSADIDLDGDNRVDQLFATQGIGGGGHGIRRIARDGALLSLFTNPSDALRVAASQPRVDTSLVTTSTGLQYRDVRVGTGAIAESGRSVSVHYVGSLRNGTIFDTSRDAPGTPFEFELGAGEVIAGWDEGVAGMRVGGRRTLIIPADLAYGTSTRPGIPANSALVFDVELLSVS